MSSPFDAFAKGTITVYGESGSDLYGAKTYTISGVVACEYDTGGKVQTDSDGVEFMPASTYYPVSTIDFDVKRGDLIAIGDKSATPNPNDVKTEKVRKVSDPTDPFGWGKDITVWTG